MKTSEDRERKMFYAPKQHSLKHLTSIGAYLILHRRKIYVVNNIEQYYSEIYGDLRFFTIQPLFGEQ